MDTLDTENPALRCSAETGFTMRMPCLEAGSYLDNTTITGFVDPSQVGVFYNNLSLLIRDEIDHLVQQGVPTSALSHPMPLRAADIVWVAEGRFEFPNYLPCDALRECALLFLVEDSGGAPLDIVAWAPSTDRIGSWLGYAWGLGEETIYAPRLECVALPVWRSPLDWLRANRRGVVLLKPQLAAQFLRDVGPLMAEDVEHGLELERQLTIAAPRIVVPASCVRRP
jgi:hypothetical protein